eukprot:21653-Chlamydomonas_euryale.AAC.3
MHAIQPCMPPPPPAPPSPGVGFFSRHPRQSMCCPGGWRKGAGEMQPMRARAGLVGRPQSRSVEDAHVSLHLPAFRPGEARELERGSTAPASLDFLERSIRVG